MIYKSGNNLNLKLRVDLRLEKVCALCQIAKK